MSEIKFGITKIVDIIITSHAKANFVKRKKVKNKIKNHNVPILLLPRFAVQQNKEKYYKYIYSVFCIQFFEISLFLHCYTG